MWSFRDWFKMTAYSSDKNTFYKGWFVNDSTVTLFIYAPPVTGGGGLTPWKNVNTVEPP